MKKIGATLLALMLMSSTMAFASPTTDFEQGKTSVDIAITKPELKTSDYEGTTKWEKKNNFDFAVTTGLGNNLALQYKYQKFDTDDTKFIDGVEELYSADGKAQEINLLYKLDKNVFAFVGAHRISGDVTGEGITGKIDTETKLQFGVTGVTKITDKLNGWATLAAGNDNNSYELGIGYKLAENTEFNLFYRYKKFDDLKFNNQVDLGLDPDYSFDAKVKGFGMGVTVKF